MRLFIICICLSLISCVSQKKQMNSTLGRKGYELIEKYGNPERKESNGNGGELWIYPRYNQAMLTTGQVVANYKYYIFYLDPNSTVYRWRVTTEPVPIQQLNVNMYIR